MKKRHRLTRALVSIRQIRKFATHFHSQSIERKHEKKLVNKKYIRSFGLGKKKIKNNPSATTLSRTTNKIKRAKYDIKIQNSKIAAVAFFVSQKSTPCLTTTPHPGGKN